MHPCRRRAPPSTALLSCVIALGEQLALVRPNGPEPRRVQTVGCPSLLLELEYIHHRQRTAAAAAAAIVVANEDFSGCCCSRGGRVCVEHVDRASGKERSGRFDLNGKAAKREVNEGQRKVKKKAVEGQGKAVEGQGQGSGPSRKGSGRSRTRQWKGQGKGSGTARKGSGTPRKGQSHTVDSSPTTATSQSRKDTVPLGNTVPSVRH